MLCKLTLGLGALTVHRGMMLIQRPLSFGLSLSLLLLEHFGGRRRRTLLRHGRYRFFDDRSYFSFTQSSDLLLGQEVGGGGFSLGSFGNCFCCSILQTVTALRAELNACTHFGSALSARYCFFHGRSPILKMICARVCSAP